MEDVVFRKEGMSRRVPGSAGRAMIVVYDEPYSPYCAKIRKILEFKGLHYRTVYVPYHDKARLLRDTRQDYVPFLRDGTRGVLWTKAVDHLEKKVPWPTVYPDGSRGYVKILEAWEYDWFEDRLWPFVAAFLERTFRDPVEQWNFAESWDRPYGTFDQIRKDPNAAWAPIDPTFRMLEDALREHRYLVGDAPTAFDFAIFGDLHAMECARVRIPAAYRNIGSWYRRVKGLGPASAVSTKEGARRLSSR